MWSILKLLAAVCLLGVAVLLVPLSHAAADGRCFGDWSEAGPVVRANDLIPVGRLLKSVARETRGKVIKVQLCGDGRGYRYNVAVSGAGGRVSWLVVDARTGNTEPLVRQ